MTSSFMPFGFTADTPIQIDSHKQRICYHLNDEDKPTWCNIIASYQLDCFQRLVVREDNICVHTITNTEQRKIGYIVDEKTACQYILTAKREQAFRVLSKLEWSDEEIKKLTEERDRLSVKYDTLVDDYLTLYEFLGMPSDTLCG